LQKNALEGIKVIDFTWAAVGPVTTKYLADFGATVIRIESPGHPCPTRLSSPFKDGIVGVNRSGFYSDYNSSKLGIAIDLSNHKGREIAWKLIGWADVVAESFAPGVMLKWGMDYESVREVRPDIIYYSTCQQGQYGPHSHFAGYGQLAASTAGFYHLSGWPDRQPAPPYGAYMDFINPRFAAAAIMAALDYRRRTGKGQHIDQSQVETGLQFLAPVIMDCMVNGLIANRQGNRLPYAVPHGVYHCKGNDRWCAIAVTNELQWRTFCNALCRPEWLADTRFATFLSRKRNEDELDHLINRWTIKHTPEEVMSIMQSAGVPAGIAQNGEDLFRDPQLSHRGHFRYLHHVEIGTHAYDGPAFKLSKTPDTQSAAPALGQHNEFVFKEIVGLSDDEIADYLIEGVIAIDTDLYDFGSIT